MEIWEAILERFEEQAPASVMAYLALERALPTAWINEIFETHRQRQYPRELLFSTVVELMTLVTLGLRPSLHAAARKMPDLGVSLAALYDKVKRTEPAILRALAQGSAERLAPVMAELGDEASSPGWQLRVLDGNHLPASEKRLGSLRVYRGVALPGHTLVVYDLDSGLVCDIAPCENAHESERAAVPRLMDAARHGQAWIADRHFCAQSILRGSVRRAQHSSCANTPSIPGWRRKANGATGLTLTPGGCASKVSQYWQSTASPRKGRTGVVSRSN